MEQKLKEISHFEAKIHNELLLNLKWQKWTSHEWRAAEKRQIIYEGEFKKILNWSLDKKEPANFIIEDIEVKKDCKDFNEKVEKISNDFERFIQQISFEKRFLYRLESNIHGTQFLVYDIVENQTVEKYIESKILLDNGTLAVRLPNYELFCIGNWPYGYKPQEISGTSCIIDLTNFTIKKVLSPGPRIRYSGGAYLNHAVYTFGGYDGHHLKSTAKRYDLTKNRWFNIPDLPKASDYCSCVVFKGKILLSGVSHKIVYKFDTEIESYSEIRVKPLEWRKEKNLFIGNSRVYIIQWPPAVFESNTDDEYNWSYIGKVAVQPYIFDEKETNKNDMLDSVFIDFKTNKINYFLRFDFKSKVIEEIQVNSINNL
ncbi:unnamed protein product [Blepharisma stoltei]|uniref:Uncharacterized protein n=1 Tax=Blepharisma stoltei TaxID=1481888 RepID=A0AAU9J3W1_9CILI|nr:unnamed protein product [Blepharisma stoltei]